MSPLTPRTRPPSMLGTLPPKSSFSPIIINIINIGRIVFCIVFCIVFPLSCPQNPSDAHYWRRQELPVSLRLLPHPPSSSLIILHHPPSSSLIIPHPPPPPPPPPP